MFNYNSLTDKELKSYFKGYKFCFPPRRHQLLTFAHALGENKRRLQFFHGIGTGKTLSALWMIQHFWEPYKTLVVCPRSAFRAWRRDCENIGWSYCVLEGTTADRQDMLCNDNIDIFIVNYEGLKSIYANLERYLIEDSIPTRSEAEAIVDKKGGFIMIDDEHSSQFMVVKRAGWQIDPTQLIDDFDCVVFDEVHKCKDEKSLQSQICYHLSWRANFAIGMTGTPISTSLLDLWPTMRVVDLGQSLGQCAVKFRRRYFRRYGWGDWAPLPDTEMRILKAILPFTTSFSRDECLDLPDSTYQERTMPRTNEQIKLMDKVIQGLRIELDEGTLNAGNVLARSQKLRQITGGFVYVKDGDERITHKLEHNNKLEILNDVIDEFEGKIIIFHEYPPEGEIIEAWATDMGLSYASLRGATKDKEEEERRFIEDPSVDLLIANPTVGGESLDLTTSAIEVFYSHSASIVKRDQAEGRIRRSGQNKRQLFIDNILKGSPDEALVGKAADRRELSNRMLYYIQNYGSK